MSRYYRYLVIPPLALLILFLPLFAVFSAEKEVKAAVTVAAVVPSKVSTSYSETTISPTKVLADASQSAVVSVILKDSTQSPMEGISVCAYSNRGAIDKIIEVDASGNPVASAPWGLSVALAATNVINGNTCTVATTDTSGRAYLRVTSNVPGEAIITIIADNLVKLAELKLTFLALPFPKYVSIGFEVPKFISKSGEVTIFKPSGGGPENTEMVNLGVRIVIPFWVVMLLIIFTILTPIMFFIIIALLGKIKRLGKEQKEEIEKTEQIVEKEAEKIDEIAEKEGISGPRATPST